MIIPAKASSTRLPGKNLKLFCGHPLVAWSIVQGVYAKCIDEVWVSTDSDEIRRVAEWYGAKVMMRNYVDEVDTSGTVPVQEFINRQLESGGLAMDDILATRLCTTPGLKPDDIDNMWARFQWMKEHYDAEGIGMRHERRTAIFNRKVVDGVCREIGVDAMCHNSGLIVESLAALSFNTVKNSIPGQMSADEEEHIRLNLGEYPHSYYYNVEKWQWHDVDTLEEFEIAELETEYFLLKGRDMLEVYKGTK